MCISGIYAFTNSSILRTRNQINTGAIRIELNEYSIVDGQEILYTDSESAVLPGQIISLIPRISNIGDSSYVRAKISYTGEDNSAIRVSDNNIEGMTENWVKKGDYWYYRNVVNSGDSVDFFKNVKIPTDLPNEYQGKTIQFNVVAEAIQADNFTPNFDSSAPWNGINAESANTTYQSDKIQLSQNATVEYENSANLYLDVPETFLNQLSHMVPGDTVTGEISINNKNKNALEYFVSTDKVEGISQKGNELLEKLQLKIVSDKGVIYEGKAYKLDNCSLGIYDPDTISTIRFSVTMPIELGNEFANLGSAINWEFSVAEKEQEPEKQPEPAKEESPQTGDIKFIIAIAVFVISTIGLIVVICLERKTKK